MRKAIRSRRACGSCWTRFAWSWLERRRAGKPSRGANVTSIRWKLPDTLQILHEYWQMKRIGSALPQFSDIALTEIPLVTPHLLLLDVLRAGEDFRYRHIGQALSQAVGTDYTGRRMSEALQGRPSLHYVLAIHP